MDIEPEIIEGEDPELGEGQEEKAENKIAKMREELNTCRQEKQEYMNGWQRAKADYVNALKRFESDAKASGLRGKVKAVETLLPAFDALERAKEHGDVPEGFMGIARQLESAFADLGLEEIGKVGDTFNPTIHDALGQDAIDTIETDDTVTVVLEKGWKISSTSSTGLTTGGLGTDGDIVIRPAKVRVAHFSAEA